MKIISSWVVNSLANFENLFRVLQWIIGEDKHFKISFLVTWSPLKPYQKCKSLSVLGRLISPSPWQTTPMRIQANMGYNLEIEFQNWKNKNKIIIRRVSRSLLGPTYLYTHFFSRSWRFFKIETSAVYTIKFTQKEPHWLSMFQYSILSFISAIIYCNFYTVAFRFPHNPIDRRVNNATVLVDCIDQCCI